MYGCSFEITSLRLNDLQALGDDGQWEYQVKFKGYSHKKDEWYSESDLPCVHYLTTC
jgi:hypothetical protein